MSGTDSLKLVARLSGAGLLFDIADLLEVVAAPGAGWESSGPPGLGSIRFRDSLLPVFDLRRMLQWGETGSRQTGNVLAFRDDGQDWGILVDEVAGIYPAGDFSFHDVPVVIRREQGQSYRRLALWQGEPLVCCRLDLLARQRSLA